MELTCGSAGLRCGAAPPEATFGENFAHGLLTDCRGHDDTGLEQAEAKILRNPNTT